MSIEIVDGKAYIDQVRQLLIDYTTAFGRDLGFQNLEDELADPAAKYTPPAGELLVALENGIARGMVAYHRHSDERCEMKRLYIDPSCRGQHISEQLVNGIIDCARRAGYSEMVLDVVAPSRAAIHVYQKYGFTECDPYYHNPFPDVIYMSKSL